MIITASALVAAGEDCGYRAFMDTVDTLIMGRNTYEKVLALGEWPYGNTPVIVLSHIPISFPPRLPRSVSHSAEAPRALRRWLTQTYMLLLKETLSNRST